MYERSKNILECHIAGFTYYDGLEVLDSLSPGTVVDLQSEPDNPYDPEAVTVSYAGTKLGYLPKTKNSFISSLLYFGYGTIIEAKINSKNTNNEPEDQIRIVVRLKDNRTEPEN